MAGYIINSGGDPVTCRENINSLSAGKNPCSPHLGRGSVDTVYQDWGQIDAFITFLLMNISHGLWHLRWYSNVSVTTGGRLLVFNHLIHNCIFYREAKQMQIKWKKNYVQKQYLPTIYWCRDAGETFAVGLASCIYKLYCWEMMMCYTETDIKWKIMGGLKSLQSRQLAVMDQKGLHHRNT